MAEPGIIDRVLDAFRPSRPDLLKQGRESVRALVAEWDAANTSYNKVNDDADDLERRVDATNPERLAAADQYAADAKTAVDTAFTNFTTTLRSQVDRLRGSTSLGRSRDLEDALHDVEPMMEPAREKYKAGLDAARAIVDTAKASLGEPATTTAPERARTDLREPRRAPRPDVKRRGRAKDTLRAAQRRRNTARPQGRTRS